MLSSLNLRVVLLDNVDVKGLARSPAVLGLLVPDAAAEKEEVPAGRGG